MRRLRPLLLLISLLTLPQAAQPDSAPPKVATAAVAMPDRYGAQASAAVLERGGNAVDAAVTAGFVLAVTYIEAGNLGGGGFMLIHMDGENAFLDYRETAPKAASRDMYLDDKGEVIPQSSTMGAKAIGVPGTVAGLWMAHQRFGSLPWKELVQPAIELARSGFIPSDDLIDDIAEFLPYFGDKTNFGDYFGDLKKGAVLKQPELALTLERIAANGPAGFYEGETANLIVSEMDKRGGLISLEDLASYQPLWREPLAADWREYQILSAPPPSSGGFAVIQLVKMKDFLGEDFEGLAHNSPQYVHLIAEMEKRVFADRAEYLGDPEFVEIDMKTLISDDYIKRRAGEVNKSDISSLEAVPPGLESPDTTHYSIIDQWGNAVSNTYTLNWSYGSGVVVSGAGFLLNNEMDDFSIKPGVPNIFGVVGGDANAVEPNKRPLSSMSPTMLMKDGKPFMVVGTPGGSTIFTSVFQAIINVLDYDMTALQAVDASRFHHQLLPPDLITMSPSRPLPSETIQQLEDKGYRVEPHSWEFGDVQLIIVNPEQIDAASDPRNRGETILIEPITTR
ncbi:MAG: gamma-glutamyltransferase [Pseudomonadota bacterium]